MHGYVHKNADKVPTGTLSKSDWKHFKIIAWPDGDFNGEFMSKKTRTASSSRSLDAKEWAATLLGVPTN